MKILSNSKRGATLIALVAALFFVGAVALGVSNVSADASGPMTGWLWSGGASGGTPEVSGGIGWISLNCSNTSTCGTVNYGLTVAPDGTISGYAWSENIGWVSANSADLAGCPTGICEAKLLNGALTGWFKALSGGTLDSGGWSGWISLSGTSPYLYGPTQVNGVFSRYAWGSDIVGWIDFSGALGSCTPATTYTCPDTSTIVMTNTSSQCAVTTTNTTCTSPSFCSPGSAVCHYPPPTPTPSSALTGRLQVKPQIVRAGGTTQAYWNIAHVSSCSVTNTIGNSWTGSTSGPAGQTSNAINQLTTFTLACTGLDGSSFNESVTVSTAPVFQEAR